MRITPLAGGGYVLEPYTKEETQALDKLVKGLRRKNRGVNGSSSDSCSAMHSRPLGHIQPKGCEAR